MYKTKTRANLAQGAMRFRSANFAEGRVQQGAGYAAGRSTDNATSSAPPKNVIAIQSIARCNSSAKAEAVGGITIQHLSTYKHLHQPNGIHPLLNPFEDETARQSMVCIGCMYNLHLAELFPFPQG